MSIYDDLEYSLSYVALALIATGLVFNTICFLIFRLTSEFKKMSSMVYLSVVVILDTVSLFDWNLDHYLVPHYNLRTEYLSVFTCKVFSFGQYYSLQASGILLSFVSIDRFVAIRTTPGSFYSKLPFGTVKSAWTWSIIVLITLFILNCHIIIFNAIFSEPEWRNRTLNSSTGISINETYMYQDSVMICNVYKDGFQV